MQRLAHVAARALGLTRCPKHDAHEGERLMNSEPKANEDRGTTAELLTSLKKGAVV